MMKNKFIIAAVVCLFILGACANDKKSENSSKTASPFISNVEGARKLAGIIDSLENVVFVNDSAVNESAARELLETYERYVKRYGGDDKKGPEYLYKAAAIYRGLKQPVEAILFYDRILSKYPNYERNPEVAFLTGFTYEADLNEREHAKEAYRQVVELYPDDMWAIEAQARLETIDLTDEELIKSFMEKNQNQ